VPPAATTHGVVKRFGETVALDGVDLVVEQGVVFGLLGPNGAGKTTLVRLLTTLLRPNEGRAEVFGRDVIKDPAGVRREIGLAGQFAAVDELLTGRENLRMFGRLFHLRRKDAAERADELLQRFDLADAADRQVKGYSGGMRRRLDLASSLLVAPRMLFLDEPTTGLDPRSRTQIWEVIRELARGGTTILLTTQYLEEADELADRIAVIDHGRLIAEGTSDELKERVGGQVVEIRLATPEDAERAYATLARLGGDCGEPSRTDSRVSLPVGGDGVEIVASAANALRDADVGVLDLALHRPTLDDVFLELTCTGSPATR
jgi:daunorubicin resistance ABC transporter ATP-binding subunit